MAYYPMLLVLLLHIVILYLLLKTLSQKMSTIESTAIVIEEPKSGAKAKAPVLAAATPAAGWKRGISIMDFILRLCGIAAALAATITMGTADQTLQIFTQLFQFQANYSDLPAFSFFVFANAIAGGYLVLSLPFSIVTIVRPQAAGMKFLLLTLDTVALALTTSAAGAAAAIVYLVHKGNQKTNWVAICQQFGDFCQRVSGAVVASFIASVIFMVLVLLSAASLRRN